MDCPAPRSITLIGTGNVAWHLAHGLRKAGNKIVQICSRSMANATQLAAETDASPTDRLQMISPTAADVYIISVSDSFIEEIAAQLELGNRLLLHTAGSIDKEVLAKGSSRYGVAWPVQTLVKGLPMPETPFCIEGSDKSVNDDIAELLSPLSHTILPLDIQQRRVAHLAATMVSNFGNAINALSQSLLSDQDIDFALLQPIIATTAKKAQHTSDLWEQQTGAARRRDSATLQKHMELLQSKPEAAELYSLMTRIIQNHTC
ncbi:MAG: DUF2520 domain-containing protein [Bacteroidales bacterium]|nr:DUF2520 domain-containing protein [Bacteroidales bacterium]